MSPRNRSHIVQRSIGLVVGILFATCPAGFRASGDDGKSILDSKQLVLRQRAVSFARALEEISHKTGLNILALDSPRSVLAADLNVQGSSRTVVDAVAVAFDYQWTESSNGTILFTKRFAFLEEHPQIVREEALEVFKGFLDLFSSLGIFVRRDGFAEHLRQVFASMAPIQREAALSDSGLPVTALSASQKVLIQRAVIGAAFGGILRIWSDVPAQLSSFERSKIEATESRSRIRRGSNPREEIISTKLGYLWRDGLHVYKVRIPHHPGIYSSPEVTR